MVITIGPDLEAALNESARKQGVGPEELAVKALRECFLKPSPVRPPQDDWERRLRSAASDCGVAPSDEAVSSEGLYD
jgi:hypothetical protein